MEKHRKKAKKKYKILLIIFVIIIIVCVGILLYILKNSSSNKSTYEEINQNINSEDTQNTDNKVTENVEKVTQLKNVNTDIIGWIKIDDTMIDYPILQTTDNEYYLKHNYKKEKTQYGSIYLKNVCNIKDTKSNLIIYGHYMKDGQMFNNLLKYKEKSFYEEHRIIRIATETEESKYEIVSVFKSRIFYQDEKDVFRYYNYINFEDEEMYNEYIENCKKIQLYDTGVSAEYGEQLITLITCEYSQKNGRIVVVAKKIN